MTPKTTLAGARLEFHDRALELEPVGRDFGGKLRVIARSGSYAHARGSVYVACEREAHSSAEGDVPAAVFVFRIIGTRGGRLVGEEAISFLSSLDAGPTAPMSLDPSPRRREERRRAHEMLSKDGIIVLWCDASYQPKQNRTCAGIAVVRADTGRVLSRRQVPARSAMQGEREAVAEALVCATALLGAGHAEVRVYTDSTAAVRVDAPANVTVIQKPRGGNLAHIESQRAASQTPVANPHAARPGPATP